MATRFDKGSTITTEAEEIEKLVGEAEVLLDEEDSKKDLKERRKIIKLTSYVGPYKLKHMIPKGKHL